MSIQCIDNTASLLAVGTDSAASIQHHPVLQKLASELDLCHTCGYVTLLKTGKGVNCDQHPLVAVDDTDTRPSTECSNNNSSSSGSCPRNGITNTASAEMLALELDSLDAGVDEKTPSVSGDRTGLALDIGGSDAPTKSCDACSHSDWVLLDCCYGIPLFDSVVNREVCDRIASQKLCNSDRWVID